jgi:hypothetical protein
MSCLPGQGLNDFRVERQKRQNGGTAYAFGYGRSKKGRKAEKAERQKRQKGRKVEKAERLKRGIKRRTYVSAMLEIIARYVGQESTDQGINGSTNQKAERQKRCKGGRTSRVSWVKRQFLDRIRLIWRESDNFFPSSGSRLPLSGVYTTESSK